MKTRLWFSFETVRARQIRDILIPPSNSDWTAAVDRLHGELVFVAAKQLLQPHVLRGFSSLRLGTRTAQGAPSRFETLSKQVSEKAVGAI